MGSPVAPVPNQPIDVVPPSPAVVPEGDATKAWANFAQGLPEDLPETAYNALAERFYDERVAPDVIAKGYATDPIRRKFLSNVQREKVSRTELVAKEAAGALMAPMEALSEQVGGPILPDRSFVGKAQHAEALAHRQGMAVAPYALLGQGIGMAPYFALPMEGAGALGGAVAAGKGLQAVINAGAGALAQGAYDAAKAPTGGRLMAGVQGGLAGAATIGGIELLHNAGPIMRAIKGINTPAEAEAATEQIIGDPKLEEKIASEVQQQNAAAKRAGMPLSTPLGKQDGSSIATVKAQDGQTYKVSDPIAQAPLISQHLNVGGSVEQVGGDLSKVADTLRTIENIQASNGAFDTEAGATDVTGPSKVKANVSQVEAERAGKINLGRLRSGQPGISVEGDPVLTRMRKIVYRDQDGNPQGYLHFYLDDDLRNVAPPEHGLYPEIYVNPEARRQGIATQLYDAAQQSGYDLSKVSGTETTPAGAAFLNARRGSEWIKPEEGGPAVPPALPGFDFEKFKEDPLSYFNEQAQKEPQPETPEPDNLAELLQRSIDQRKAQLDIPKVRGSTPIPLDQQGQMDAMELGRKSRIKGGFDEIHSGPLPRHVQTADALEMFNPLAVRPKPNPEITSRQWAILENLNQDDIKQAMDWYMRNSPDSVPPGVSPTSGLPGESTNQLIARLLPQLQNLADRAKAENKKIAAVVSSSDIAVAAAKAKGGDKLDYNELADMHEAPGDVYSWDGGSSFQHVNMDDLDTELQPLLHLIRHGHTAMNDPKVPDDLAQLLEGARQVGAVGKETPLARRYVGDIPFLREKGAVGATVGGTGEKPSIFYTPEVNRNTIFEENFHAGIGYHDMRDWLRNELISPYSNKTVSDIYDRSGLRKAYPDAYMAPEETLVKVLKAIRTGDADSLKTFAKADKDMENLLGWATEVSRNILDRVSEEPDSLPKRAMERRIGSVVARATNSLDEMNHPFAASTAKLDIEKGRWKVTTPGEERYFDSREEAIQHLEDNHSQPLNTPELADFSMLPDGVAHYARDVPPPNNSNAPLVGNPPPPEKKPRLGGLALASRYFRPFQSWIADVSEKTERPELFQAFRALDDAQIQVNNFNRPYEDVLEDSVRKIPEKLRSSLFKLVQAAPEDRPTTAESLGLTKKELNVFDEFNEKFVKPLETELGASFDTFVREIMPRRLREGVDSNRPKFPFVGQKDPFGAYKEAMDVGEIDPHDQNLLKAAYNYLRVGSRDKFMGTLLNDASKIVDEVDEDGNYKLGLFRTSLARHVEYLRGHPDHTTAVLNSIASHVIDLMNTGFEKVNPYLPEALRHDPIELPPREAWSKMIKFMYAGELAARPALLIRDALGFFTQTAPILGGHIWKGIERSFGEGAFARGAADKNVWVEPRMAGALLEKRDLQSLFSGGEDKGEGWLERQADKAMSFIQFAHNSNRVMAYWGFKAKASEALDKFLSNVTDANAKTFLSDSGLWFLKKPVRDMYLKEVQKLDSTRSADFSSDVDAVSRRIAKDMVESTQWNLRRGANPGLYEYQLGRLIGQYGTWPLNYIEYARRYGESLLDPDTRGEAMKAMVRFTLAHGAIQAAGNAAGVDLSNWLWMNPAGFEGGPALTMMQSLPSAFSTTDKGSEARKELRREFIFPGFIPGGEAVETMWKAAVEDDPHFWTRAMGFTPLEGRSELRK